jgi:hypothetical protein
LMRRSLVVSPLPCFKAVAVRYEIAVGLASGGQSYSQSLGIHICSRMASPRIALNHTS